MGISNKGRVIILAAWTVLLVIVALVIGFVSKPKATAEDFSSYSYNSYDEVLALNASVSEERYSSSYDSNLENKGESSTWDLNVRLEKIVPTLSEDVEEINYSIDGYKCYLTVFTTSGEKILKEKKSSSTIISEKSSSSRYDFSFSKFAQRKINTVGGETIDETPDKIYIWFIYGYTKTTVYKDENQSEKVETGENAIKYIIDIVDLKKVVKPTTLSSIDHYIAGSDDDNLRTYISVSKDNKVNDSLDKYDRLSTSIRVYARDIQNEMITNIDCVIIGVVANDRNDTSDSVPNYVILNTYSGSTVNRSTPFKTNYAKIDTKLQLSEVYVYINATTKTETITTSYRCVIE